MIFRLNILLPVFCACALMTSCSSVDGDTENITEMLEGIWILDSVSLPDGSFQKAGNDSRKLIFNNETDFIYAWSAGDVANTSKGKYFILDNPKRRLKTISLIPDLIITGKDTIRPGYMDFDMAGISANRLRLVDETSFIRRNSLPSIIFNKQYIYKRRE